MPTTNVKLGHNCKFKIDGVAIEGTRDVEMTVSTKTVDATAWDHGFTSTLPVSTSLSVRATLYWQSEVDDAIWERLLAQPKQRVRLDIEGVAWGYFVVSEVRIAAPMNAVLAYDVTFVGFNYE